MVACTQADTHFTSIFAVNFAHKNQIFVTIPAALEGELSEFFDMEEGISLFLFIINKINMSINDEFDLHRKPTFI